MSYWKWVYAPEFDKLEVFDMGTHNAKALEIYSLLGLSPSDDSGWNRWYGGAFQQMLDGYFQWKTHYVPLEIETLSRSTQDYGEENISLPEHVKQQLNEVGEKLSGKKYQSHFEPKEGYGGSEIFYNEEEKPFADLIEPSSYDPNYWKQVGLKESGTFGYIGGHLILANAHHQAIIGALMEKGWEWETLFTIPQTWGWFSMDVNGYEVPGRISIILQFTSDSGAQNINLIDDTMIAFAETYHLPVKPDEYITGVKAEENYGSGLRGKQKLDEYARGERQDIIENKIHSPIPEPTNKTAHLWAESARPLNTIEKLNMSSAGELPLEVSIPFAYLNGELVFGSKGSNHGETVYSDAVRKWGNNNYVHAITGRIWPDEQVFYLYDFNSSKEYDEEDIQKQLTAHFGRVRT